MYIKYCLFCSETRSLVNVLTRSFQSEGWWFLKMKRMVIRWIFGSTNDVEKIMLPLYYKYIIYKLQIITFKFKQSFYQISEVSISLKSEHLYVFNSFYQACIYTFGIIFWHGSNDAKIFPLNVLFINSLIILCFLERTEK